METSSALLVICAENSPVPITSPHKGQWRGALMLSLICPWIYGWVNTREAGELRRYRAHYDVIVMDIESFTITAWLYTSCCSQNADLNGKFLPLQWRQNGHDGISNHQPHDCLLNRLFRCWPKKTSKLSVAGLCVVTGEFPAQRASNAEQFPLDVPFEVIMGSKLSHLPDALTMLNSVVSFQPQNECRIMNNAAIACDDLC